MLCGRQVGSIRPSLSRQPLCGHILPALKGVFGGPGRKCVGVAQALGVPAAGSALPDLYVDSNVIASVADAAANPNNSSGPFDFLADIFQSLLTGIDSTLEAAHVPYSYGFAIIVVTVLVKAATFPLSQKQVESTVAMQALQPRIKELQAKYEGQPETLQAETAKMYKAAGVNPLAGCLPALATIPVFIGLYKALSRAADEGLGQESFFWIPDLSGPSNLTERTAGAGLTWLFPFVDGHPPIGWANAGAYLIMPALLVASQYASMKIIAPPVNKEDTTQQQSQAILQFLPLMIGWFSLNVPSGLTLYWFVNNILSTGQQLYLKETAKVTVPEPLLAASTASTSTGTIVKPKEEQRTMKNTGKDVGARRKRKDSSDEETSAPSASASPAAQPVASKGSKAARSSRSSRALEAASKAAQAAAAGPDVPEVVEINKS